jgi:hypothetical protein
MKHNLWNFCHKSITVHDFNLFYQVDSMQSLCITETHVLNGRSVFACFKFREWWSYFKTEILLSKIFAPCASENICCTSEQKFCERKYLPHVLTRGQLLNTAACQENWKMILSQIIWFESSYKHWLQKTNVLCIKLVAVEVCWELW